MGQKTPENSSRASSPSCSDCENFPMVPTLETSYLARAAKNEFLNLVPDIEEMRPGSSALLRLKNQSRQKRNRHKHSQKRRRRRYRRQCRHGCRRRRRFSSKPDCRATCSSV
ncbi:uncharacterized protein LOC143419943 isoform X2 [Maylandia zebra]|uniref:uncharacterized protein LOC143419776 isoform X2 n=1 Tax=Maylandia zebra TaxID=106582 RepID=UPI00403D2B8A